LIAPSAQASKPSHHRVSVVANCDEGQAALTTTVDRSGREHGKVTLTGLRNKRWHGGLVLAPERFFSDDSGDGFDALYPHKLYVAKHGRITASSSLRDARTLDAMATFNSGVKTCSVSVFSNGQQYAVQGAMDGLGVRTDHKPVVVASVSGEAHHRYRITLSVRTAAGVQHRTVVNTAGVYGAVEARVADFKKLSSFTDAQATVTDLNLHTVIDRFELKR
jgi:hypothetical protein